VIKSRNSAGFCGGGQGLGWAVEPRKEEEEIKGGDMGGHVAHKILVGKFEEKS
jgi:hypothetical protein